MRSGDLGALLAFVCGCSMTGVPTGTGAREDAAFDLGPDASAHPPSVGDAAVAGDAAPGADSAVEPTPPDPPDPPEPAPYAPPKVVVSTGGSVTTSLRCGIPWAEGITASHRIGLIGSAVTSIVGMDQGKAGIGGVFELANNAHKPTTYVNVLETRSGAGAAWQTSSLVWDNPGGVGIMVFNQGAGNNVGSQWAYATTANVKGVSIQTSRWMPIVSDHIHEKPGGHSPCNGTGYLFDDGKQDLFGSKVPTAHGDAILWQNAFSYRSRVNQSWPNWTAEQAFYLSRRVARNGNLRVYLRRGATKHGPVRPYDPFTLGNCTTSHCNTLGYDYAVLVWNIHGRDIGVAIPDLGRGISLNLERTTYCADANNDSCGNINFHAWLPEIAPANFPAGKVRTYWKNYFVGTLPQLADLGFETW